ncbi:pentatricopeptide repeat-containing protein At5g66520-like [Aristolochia californica]|uniref:pentatricopeptide repeat-containing protein At5g66520-like n=1 Tax=Aristolochia californica TaxID=171875 RepID=UPI0035E17D0F
MEQLKQIHSQMIVLGLVHFTYVTSRILAFSAISDGGNLVYAQLIFDKISDPTIFNWNIMIRGYSRSSEPEKGLRLFGRMRASGVQLNMHTFPFTIKACTTLLSVMQVHGQVVKYGFDLDVYVVSSMITSYSNCKKVELARRVFDGSVNRNIVSWTSLISGYCACGLVDEARKIFDEMPERNVVSWSAMISGYVQNDCSESALELFRQLRAKPKLNPNRSLLVSVLNACAGLGASEEGKWVHSYIEKHKMEYGVELGTALIDFYTKCGSIESAREVFDEVPIKDVMAWSAMIMGLAVNGHSDAALDLFGKMEKSEAKPNEVTFIGVLTACNHGGLVDKGWECFELMRKVYHIPPALEHYGCMVDLLGRAGQIEEAKRLIDSMPMKPDGVMWGALLNGCMMHKNLVLGEEVGRCLIELEPQHSGRYVLLANIYASLGKWEDVMSVRKMMRERRVAVAPGCSFIEINGCVHRFFADDKSHAQSQEVYKMLDELNPDRYLYSQRVLVQTS